MLDLVIYSHDFKIYNGVEYYVPFDNQSNK